MKTLAKLVLLLTLLCGAAFGVNTVVTPTTINIKNANPGVTINMVLGSDGLARIVQLDKESTTPFIVRYVRCLNASCSSVHSTVFTLPAQLFVGSSGASAISLGPGDLPRIAILGQDASSGTHASNALGYVTCADVDCTSNTVTFLGFLTQGNSFPIGSGTFIFNIVTNSSDTSYILYRRTPRLSAVSSLELLSCTGTTCTSANTIVPSFSNTACYGQSLALASDGTPRVAYALGDCSTAASVFYWVGGTTTTVATDARIFVTQVGLALSSDDTANISWGTADNNNYEFVHCTNSLCSTKLPVTSIPIVQDSVTSLSLVNIAIGADGFSRLALAYIGPTQPSPGGTTIAKCANLSCSSFALNFLEPDTFPTNSIVSASRPIALSTSGGSVVENMYGMLQPSGGGLFTSIFYTVTEENSGDFTITAAPVGQVVTPGNSATYTITIAPVSGFSDTVSFGTTGQPAGSTATYNPTTVTGGSGTTVLTVTTLPSTTKGAYTLTVTGTSGALNHSTTVVLNVLGQKPKFVSRKTIDLLGDNPGVTIPVRSKDGKIPFTYSLIENPVAFTFQNQWVIATQMVGVSSPALVYYAPQYLSAPAAGQPAVAPLPAYIQSITDSLSATPSAITIGTAPGQQGWFFIDSSYVSHFFDVTGVSGAALINDGSGYTLTASGSSSVLCQTAPCPTIVDVGGNIVANNNNKNPNFRGNVASFTDPDGVLMTAYAAGDPSQTVLYNDTLGQTALTAAETNATSVPPDGPLPTNVYTYASPSGVQKYVVSYGRFYQSTNFGCDGITEMPRTPVFLPVKVTLPDGSFYTLQYEPTPGGNGDVTGRLSLVRTPTGGQTTYLYRGTNNGVNCADGSIPILIRTTSDGTWTYVHILN
jgi:hypothetical protein